MVVLEGETHTPVDHVGTNVHEVPPLRASAASPLGKPPGTEVL